MLSLSSRYAVAVALMLSVSPWLDWPQANAAGKLNDSMIVSTEWLAKHLNDDALVLLQVGEKKEFDEAHIPGARFVQLT
jgi:hypothetical protein